MAMANRDDMLPVSRRELAALITVGVAFAASPSRVVGDGMFWSSRRRPVVGFHNDSPWLDVSGRDTPYYPPTARGRFAPDSETLMRLGFFL